MRHMSKTKFMSDGSIGMMGRLIGTYRILDYPSEFVTLPDYTEHAGQRVKVLRQCSQREADQGEGMERMYHIRAADGWRGLAWVSELRRKA